MKNQDQCRIKIKWTWFIIASMNSNDATQGLNLSVTCSDYSHHIPLFSIVSFHEQEERGEKHKN